MPVFTRVKVWVSNEVLTASDLNGEFNNLLNNTKPASIESYSADISTMQSTTDPGGVGTESLATTLAGELQRLRFVIKRLGGVAQWYVSGRNFGTGAMAVETADLQDGAVTTVKIADGAVTKTKLAALGQSLSSSSGVFSTTSSGATDVTNLTVTFTSTGRPLKIGLVSDGGNQSTIGVQGGSTDQHVTMDIILNEVAAGGVIDFQTINFQTNATASGAVPMISSVPVTSLYFIVWAPTVGSHTYKIQIRRAAGSSSASVFINFAKLFAYEL